MTMKPKSASGSSKSTNARPNRIFDSRWLVLSPLSAALLVFLFVSLACGGAEESGRDVFVPQSGYGLAGGAGDEALASKLVADDGVDSVVVEREVAVEKAVEVVREAEMSEPAELTITLSEGSGEFQEEAKAVVANVDDEFGENVDISIQPQNRIIVRNADMVIESNHPVVTIAAINNLAISLGGWVVNSNTSDIGFYNITIRVPADKLDSVIDQVSAIAEKVELVTSDSTDFTEEYIDLGARRKTVQETVDALSALLKSENYKSVEELLEVRREITNWQSELEIIDGRMSFISQSAAYSRLTVTVNRSPMPMHVDVGEDIHIGIGIPHKFTARFHAPDGYDRYEITWNFGDGSPPQTVNGALKTQNEEGLLSVPVAHTYYSDELAPHVVTVSIRAFSDRGLAEGEDSQWVQVSELPSFDAFVAASENDVQEGRPITLTASFNHPDTVRNVEYEWDVRDGSKIKSGVVPAGETNVELEHTFERYRPDSYQVVFKITGESDAGEVEETREAYVYVYPAPSVDSASFEPAGTATNAFNVLVNASSFAGNALIWLAITSPIWLILGAITFFSIRFLNRRRGAPKVVLVPKESAADEDEAQEESGN